MQRLLNLDDIRDDDLDSSETSAVLQIHFDSKQDQVILYNPVNVLVQRGSGKEASSINPNDTILEKHISDSVWQTIIQELDEDDRKFVELAVIKARVESHMHAIQSSTKKLIAAGIKPSSIARDSLFDAEIEEWER